MLSNNEKCNVQSLLQITSRAVIKHEKSLRQSFCQLPDSLRTALNMTMFDSLPHSWYLRACNLESPLDNYNRRSMLLNRMIIFAPFDERYQLEIEKQSMVSKIQPLFSDPRLCFHVGSQPAFFFMVDEYRFAVMMDPKDRKRLWIVRSEDQVEKCHFSFDCCPNVPRYGCKFQYGRRRQFSHHGIGESRRTINVPLAKFITQNPYIDYMLSPSEGVVLEPQMDFRERDDGPVSLNIRIQHHFKWLHLIVPSMDCNSGQRRLQMYDYNIDGNVNLPQALRDELEEPSMPFVY